jgi:hypothetical protein
LVAGLVAEVRSSAVRVSMSGEVVASGGQSLARTPPRPMRLAA